MKFQILLGDNSASSFMAMFNSKVVYKNSVRTFIIVKVFFQKKSDVTDCSRKKIFKVESTDRRCFTEKNWNVHENSHSEQVSDNTMNSPVYTF
jgi:hypothetical protein